MTNPRKRQKGTDEVFCRSCGEAIKKEAEICPHCGVRQRGSTSHHGKSKTTAVLLAVFLAPFNWLYTYKKDTWKFWVGLVIGLPSMFWIFFPPLLIFYIPIWIWAIIDASVKDRTWYEDF